MTEERRQYPRYDTELEINFAVNFDLSTKINYQVRPIGSDQFSQEKYSGISKNISAEGMCFVSRHKVAPQDQLFLEVLVSEVKSPIYMEGEARWCHQLSEEPASYAIGLLVKTVNGERVRTTIQIDNETRIIWSNVLDRVFSNFKNLVLEEKKKSQPGKPDKQD